jgi:ribonuclease Z
MSIKVQILGDRGADNAAFVTVNTGQANHRLLFDCGEGCAAGLPFAELQAILRSAQ